MRRAIIGAALLVASFLAGRAYERAQDVFLPDILTVEEMSLLEAYWRAETEACIAQGNCARGKVAP